MAITPLKQVIFKDLDIKFQAHPETGQLSVLKNHAAITRSIKNLVFTNKYESLFKPNVYSNVYASLFDNFDPITAQVLRNDVRDVINNYEPRAELISISLQEELDLNGITITVTYRPLNMAEPVTIDVFLERIR